MVKSVVKLCLPEFSDFTRVFHWFKFYAIGPRRVVVEEKKEKTFVNRKSQSSSHERLEISPVVSMASSSSFSACLSPSACGGLSAGPEGGVSWVGGAPGTSVGGSCAASLLGAEGENMIFLKSVYQLN